MALAAASASLRSMSATATLAPSSTYRSQMARPIPRAPPVTTATFPSSTKRFIQAPLDARSSFFVVDHLRQSLRVIRNPHALLWRAKMPGNGLLQVPTLLDCALGFDLACFQSLVHTRFTRKRSGDVLADLGANGLKLRDAHKLHSRVRNLFDARIGWIGRLHRLERHR